MYALDITCFDPAFRFSRRAMRAFAEAKNAVTVVAEAGSELVAFSIAQVEEQISYVVTLDVSPAWRRQGLAQSLMSELESRARETGALSMSLHVHSRNES